MKRKKYTHTQNIKRSIKINVYKQLATMNLFVNKNRVANVKRGNRIQLKYKIKLVELSRIEFKD